MLTAIMCTYNRHSLLERAVRFYLDQEYASPSELLIYNNSPNQLTLTESVIPIAGKNIKLVNNSVNLQTGGMYTNTGDIFRDALTYMHPDTKIVTFMDDDDAYTPYHLIAGANGIDKAYQQDKLAYKPYYSYYWSYGSIKKAHNNMEPSIFVDAEYVKTEGFHQLPCSYHQKWLDKLHAEAKLFTDPQGESTFIYDWGSNSGAFKVSGRGDDKDNFRSHHISSRDIGDGIITPWTTEKTNDFWGKINNLINKT